MVHLIAQSSGSGAEALFGLFFCGIMIVSFVLSIAALAFWVWMLIDCAANEPSEGNDKVIWILVIVLTGAIGGLIYFFVRRPQRIRQFGR